MRYLVDSATTNLGRCWQRCARWWIRRRQTCLGGAGNDALAGGFGDDKLEAALVTTHYLVASATISWKVALETMHYPAGSETINSGRCW